MAQGEPAAAPLLTGRASLADLLAKASGGGDKLVALSDAERDAQRAAEEDDRARAQALIEPHRTAGHSAITKFGILRAKHGDRVAKAAALDVRAILERVPPKIVVGLDFTPNHFSISQYITLARDLAHAFLTFKPVDFEDSLRSAESCAYRGSASPEFQNEIKRHLPWNTERLVRSVASVEESFDVWTTSKRR